jgi:3-ketosteroid 9alpha-monooxygenase subunit A
MAIASDYDLGPQTFPRGWFIIGASDALADKPQALRFFGRDFALYRGESGRPVLLDAHCKHMGTHIALADSTAIVQSGKQIEGDSIRCPYHGWRYTSDGTVDDIPYHDGPCPKSASLRSYPVQDLMGCLMMWFDPDGSEPEYAPPQLAAWEDSQWMRWRVQDLGDIAIHGIEILDNMADARHLLPTHGADCQYFENEFHDHVLIQRQGGTIELYGSEFHTITWYTGPGILLSRQEFGETLIYELIGNIPVEDGVSKVWHGTMVRAPNNPPIDTDWEYWKQTDAGALHAFSADFDVWRAKRPAIRILQMPTDGPFDKVRRWYGQFFVDASDQSPIRETLNGVIANTGLPAPSAERRAVEAQANIQFV